MQYLLRSNYQLDTITTIDEQEYQAAISTTRNGVPCITARGETADGWKEYRDNLDDGYFIFWVKPIEK